MIESTPDQAAPSEPHDPWDTIGASEREIGEADDVMASLDTPRRGASADAFEMTSTADPMETGEAVSDQTEWEIAEEETTEEQTPPPVRGGGWTLPLLCGGMALIACCVLIPQADANRRLAYEHQMLQMDLESVERQVAVNDEFLKKVADDPTLAERLAQRQMKAIPEGTRILELIKEPEGSGMSPFQLVSVTPPPPLPPYKPVGGTLARLCYDSHSRLYLIGTSLLMIAMGLVLGYNE